MNVMRISRHIEILVICFGLTGVCVYAFTRVLRAILRRLER